MRLPDGQRVTYGYDALGRRVRKRVERADGAVTREQRFVWDGHALAMELDSDRGRRSFVHGPGDLEPLLQEEQGEVFAYVTDQVGVPRELVDGVGRVAWAASFTTFGRVVEAQRDEARASPVESPFRLLGQVYDEESGLSWTLFRCFDAETGRWLSTDPLGFEAGPETFGFDGNPTLVVDLLGLATRGRPTHGGANDGQNDSAKITSLDPNSITLSHPANLATEFSDPRLGTVKDLSNKLRADPSLAGRIPPIEVFKYKGVLYSANNRRLRAFQDAGVPVRTIPASSEQEAKIKRRIEQSKGRR